MATDPPQLELNDILLNIENHLTSQPANGSIDAPLSVGPVSVAEGGSRSTSPEPPDEHEVLAMRMRAISIRDAKGKAREDMTANELVNMVLRLTTAIPARTQILEQAAIIRCMTLQRDLLFERMNEEWARWEAERDGLQRVCEALIAQANIASHNLYKEQDSIKRPTLIEAENNSLRQKLAEVQSRVSSLEAELAQLRPLLLMQPGAIAVSKGVEQSPGRSGKKEENNGGPINETRSYYRVREELKNPAIASPKSKKKKSASYFQHAPTVADARSEHLLLAMRKLGKERATILSQGMYRTADLPCPSTTSGNDMTSQGKNSASQPRPMMSPAVWPSQVQQPASVLQQSGEQAKQQPVQQAATQVPVKGQQNPPFSQFGPPPGVAYPQYFMPSGPVPRPGAAMPAPAFYHAPPRGYIPGPAWPYYTPGPYAFGQPIAIRSPAANTKPTPTAGRPATSPPIAGPSHTPALPTPLGPYALVSRQQSSGPSQSTAQAQKPPSGGRQQSEPSTPQSKSNAPTPTAGATPMENLLSAAQSVLSPDSGNRFRSAGDEGSSLPRKRKRVDDHGPVKTRTRDKQRASALDVLADQAAGVVPSEQASGSKGVPRRVEASSSAKNGHRGSASGKETGKEDARRAPSVRKGKRPVRASSTTPVASTSSSSLAPPTTVHRAASEDRAPPTASRTSHVSRESFKLRPVHANEFSSKSPHLTERRPASSPRSTAPARRGSTVRNRQPNGRASTPIARTRSDRRRSHPPVDSNAGTEENEIESEDGVEEGDVNSDAEVDQLEGNYALSPKTDGPVKEGKQVARPAGSGEDATSKRWLEILGRKES